MGQRTQLYVIEHNAKIFYGENHGGNKPRETQVLMFHNQWGYGYRQLLDALAYILSNRGTRTHKIVWDNGDDKQPNEHPTTYNKSWLEKDITAKAPQGNLFDNIDLWRNFVDYGDNNNGIVVLEIFRNYDYIIFGNIQCFRGGEDTPEGLAEGEPMTIWDYINQYNEENDKTKLYNMIKSILQFWNITEKNEAKQVFYTADGKKQSLYLPNNSTKEEILECIADNDGNRDYYDQDAEEYLAKHNIKIEL